MTNFYNKAVNLLTSKEKFHIQLGTDRVEKVLAHFNNPHNKLKIIHVAGTNGKGSVCAIINEILIQAGYKTGLFTSPHITKYTERIKINNNQIPDKDFYEIIQEVNIQSNNINAYLTEFEILTVSAFIWFQRQQTDYVVLEVGLGGRLDATNVIKKPIMSIITSISLDHTDRLGNTIEEIASEKAGIIKPNSPIIVNKNNLGLNVIKNIAMQKNASIIIPQTKINIKNKGLINIAEINGTKYEFSLPGLYQKDNLGLAIEACKLLKINEKAIKNALKTVKHICRFEILNNKNLIIDGAHNPDGARVLRESLDKYFPNTPVIFIYATLNTKDYKSVLKTLLKNDDEIFFLKFPNKNAVPPSILANYTQKTLRIIKTAKEITAIANRTQKPVVITGSLYAIGFIYENIKYEIKNTSQSANFQ